MEKVFHVNGNQKKNGILMLEKIGFKIKSVYKRQRSCDPSLLLLLIFPSIRVFPSESPLPIRWLKYWSFSFSISSSNEYSGLISFRIGWFDLLTVQGPLKSLLQHHNLKASVLQCSVSFMVQLSHLYMTTGKNTAVTIRNFVGKVISLLFNMLSRFVITFLPRSKHLLILSFQSVSSTILEHKKIKSVTVSTFSHLFALRWWDWMGCHDRSNLNVHRQMNG